MSPSVTCYITEMSATPPDPPVDLYRHTPVRYLGYANEVGEAFRAFIGSKWVAATYGVATLYVLADTSDKCLKSFQANHNASRTAYITVDTLIWQMLASVLVPGFTINRVCAMSNWYIKGYPKVSPGSRKVMVTTIGLAMIPFIIRPIDDLVDEVLDHTIRKFTPP